MFARGWMIDKPKWVGAWYKILEMFYKHEVPPQHIIETTKEIKRVQQFTNGEWKTEEVKLIFEVDEYIVICTIRDTPAMPYVFWEVWYGLSKCGDDFETMIDILHKAREIFDLLK